jgi:hypothetical protein
VYHLIGDTLPGSNTENFPTFVWQHICFTWSAASQLKVLYINGQKVAEEITATGRKITSGGVLILGQDQDTVGGGFQISQTFGGEIYRLQISKKKISAEEVVGMYKAGICDYPADSQDIVMDWEDFLDAKRYGKVDEVSAGCSKWDILKDFEGQEISPALISYLKRHHEF